MDLPDEQLRDTLNKELDLRSRSQAYTFVQVLILYWNDGDSDFRAEGLELGKLFEESFKYSVQFFPIPTNQSYLALHQFVTQWALFASQREQEDRGRALLIIHYGGHADRNDDRHSGEEKRSVWAA